MSASNNPSTPNSKNSHNTPIVIEKQNDAINKNLGFNLTPILSLLLAILTNENPTAPIIKPFKVCITVSKLGIF